MYAVPPEFDIQVGLEQAVSLDERFHDISSARFFQLKHYHYSYRQVIKKDRSVATGPLEERSSFKRDLRFPFCET